MLIAISLAENPNNGGRPPKERIINVSIFLFKFGVLVLKISEVLVRLL